MEEIKEEPEPREAIRTPAMSGINTPRIEIPTFDGNVLNWGLFWEQFQDAVHDKQHMGEIDKLMYRRDAHKDGPAKNVIHCLTHSAESYQEAIKCSKDRYDRPGLSFHEHVYSIVHALPMKADNGRELQRLYDRWNQHIRAIKAFDAYDIDTFLTAIMELKLGETTKLKLMEHINDSTKTPPYTDLLKFMDLQAQHSSLRRSSRCNRRLHTSPIRRLRNHAWRAGKETIKKAIV